MTTTAPAHTLADLTARALRAEEQHRRYTFDRYGDGASLTYYRDRSYWQGAERILLVDELGNALAAIWKQNKYGAFIGVRTLSSIVKLLGGGDLGPQIKAARAAEEVRDRAHLQFRARRNAADAALALYRPLQELLTTAALPLEEISQAVSAATALLNAITRVDAEIAHTVATRTT